MNKENKVKKITAFICCALLCLSSCGSSDAHQGDGSGMMYNVALLGNPQSLDPQYADDETSNTVISNLYSGLLKRDSSGNISCCNAESYNVSDDNTTYRFKLRTDNYWFFDKNANDKVDDDEIFPVTADDYVFALQRILDPEMQSPFAEEFSCIMGGRAAINGTAPAENIGVTAEDDYTLVITLDYPSADFPNLLASNAAFPCNKEFFLSTKGRYGLDDKSVMSNGAFFVRQWFYDPYGSNNILYMKKNSANSSDENKIYPSYLSFTIEKNEPDIRELFKNGNIDCFTTMNLGSFNKKKYSITSSRSVTLGLVFNPQDKICSNTNFRKSLAYGIDRTSLNEEIGSDVQTAFGIIPPSVTLLGRSYRELSTDSVFDFYDEAKALSFCEAAKSELNVESFGTLKLITSTNSVDSGYLHSVTRRLQDTLGFYIGIEEITQNEFDSRIESGDYQIALYPVKGSYNSGIPVLEQFPGNKVIGISENASNEIGSLRTVAELTELPEKLSLTERHILEEFSFIPIFYKNSYLITNDTNEDIVYDAFSGAVDFRIAKNFD